MVIFRKEFKLLLAGLCSVLITTDTIAQQKVAWKMQPLSIQTRWASQVDPNRPLPEYPRPQMVRENNWNNLNGLWDYAITPKDAPIPSKYQGQILVPYPIESALSGVKKQLLPSQLLWYRHVFIKPENNSGKRLLVHFGAIDWQAVVYVNGKEVGGHTGGYTAFTCDVTDAVKDGNNELVIKVYDPTDKGVGPHGKQVLNPANIYYTASSGIWQTVWLEQVPSTFINSLKIMPNVDQQQVRISVAIGSGKFIKDLNDNFNNATDLSLYTVEVVVKKGTSVVSSQKSPATSPVILAVKNARLWSPDDPFLYDLEIKLLKNGKVTDFVKSYFGMRKVDIQKDASGINRIYLNNRYTYNLGTLDQGFWPEGLYTAPTDDALSFDIKASKAMGFNTIRKHIKVEPARWYYHADKIGMLVWQDFVNPNQSLPEGSKDAFENQVKETLDQLGNYPCITTWVVFNESWGQYDQQRITEWVKNIDRSRLVNGHSGELLYVNNQLRSSSSNAYVSSDVADVHSYPFPRNVTAGPGQVQVLGEFGGIGVPVEGHLWNDLDVGWGYDGMVMPYVMKKQYAEMIDSLKQLERRGLSGSIYTQPFDVESEQNGLMTYDRAIVKLQIDTIRNINARIWPTIQNYASSTARFTAQLMDSVSRSYESRLEEFREGKRDSFFLRNLTIMAGAKKDSETVFRATKEYINHIKNPFAERNLRFILLFTSNAKGPGFEFLTKNAGIIDSVLGPNVAEKAVMKIIYNEEIAPYDKGDNPDWNAIEKRTIDKYGELGAERVWGNRLVYYATKQDWSNFGKYYKLYFDRAIPLKRSFVNINNISWLVFEHCTDVDVLQTAIEATKYSLENAGNNPNAIDTHANLLYKFGKKEEAIQWERKAVRLSNNEKLYVETLEKMEKDVPTWN